MKIGNKTLGKGLVLFLALVLLLSFAASNLFAAPGLPNPGRDPAFANEKVNVLVGFYGPPAKEVVKNIGGEIYAEFTIVNVIAASMVPQAADALERNPRVAYVELDGAMHAVETVTASSTQEVPWGIDRVFGDEKYSFLTWDKSKGIGVGVAVLDTGIDKAHKDLKVQSSGINTVDVTDFHSDVSGHGTHVAGTIAAIDNDFGVVGVAPEVNLYAVKVLNDSGSGSDSTVMKGIEWAVKQQGIKVINMSLGGGYSQSLHATCNEAYNAGYLLIASAGNNGNPPGRGDNVGYPAGYESVIAVAASDSNDRRASFSSTGPAVELIAPGVNILSTTPGNSYSTYSGTSMAAPHVSGVAALVWGVNPNLKNFEVRKILTETAKDLGLVFNHQGYGLVRADLAVAAVGGGTEPDPDEPVEEFTLTLIANPSDAGTVSDGGLYEEGETVTIIATANADYEFVNWTEGETEVSQTASFSYTMPEYNVLLTANFKEPVEEPGDPDPSPGKVTVSAIDYAAPGPHLRVTVKVVKVDEEGNPPEAGAVVSIKLNKDGDFLLSDQGTTGSDGKVTFSYREPSGTYTTVVTDVVAVELTWDGKYPLDNKYVKR